MMTRPLKVTGDGLQSTQSRVCGPMVLLECTSVLARHFRGYAASGILSAERLFFGRFEFEFLLWVSHSMGWGCRFASPGDADRLRWGSSSSALLVEGLMDSV